MSTKSKSSEWKRYKDGLWIPSFKRTYLYWFKFLQEAEMSNDHKVNWSKYQDWGGSNEILGNRFDDWWSDHWKDLFSTREKGGIPKVELSTDSVKTEAIRVSYLVWLQRNIKPEYEQRVSPHRTDASSSSSVTRGKSNAISISKKILSTEKRVGTLNLICVWDLEDERNTNDDRDVRNLVNRYLRRSKQIINNVCEGQFP